MGRRKRNGGLLLVLVAVWLAACASRPLKSRSDGGSDAGSASEAGSAAAGTAGTGAAGTGAAGTGTAGTGTAGTAGTGAAGTGAAGTGTAGSGTAGATTCADSLVGTWDGVDPHPPIAATTPPDACNGLKLYPSDDGTFGAISWWPKPERRDYHFQFDADSFGWLIAARGTVTLTYSQACLQKTTPAPTCDQLADGLRSSGIGEGIIRMIDCVRPASGGCACTTEILDAYGPGGTWSVKDGKLRLTVNPGWEGEKTIETSYCAGGGVLRFGASVDALAPGLSRVTLETQRCDDGKRSVLEDGVDCGPYCPEPCAP